MPDADAFHAYRQLADELFAGKISETELSSATIKLPPPDKDLLERIAQQVEQVSSTQPRYGWALARVAQDAAYAQNGDLFLRSFSSWWLARASNHWSQPRRVSEALSLARRGFKELNEAGWLAACDWQENALAWTKPNFAEAARALKEALPGLESNGLAEFIPECRLALAYAQILIGQHEAALENIRLSEETYRARGDRLNQARCWLNQASSLRRRDHFEEAYQKLGQALSVFEQENALTDQAKAHYQIALGHLLKADDLSKAILHFKKAVEFAEATELDLWRGMSFNNLGSVYLINGQLKQAQEQYHEARTCFVEHDIPGLLADNLNDSGKLNILMGKPAVSVEQFQQAEAINERLGSRLSAAIVVSNLGEAYGQLGRYQDALHHLERAVEQLETFKIFFRLATCEKYMALIWSRLGQPQTAHKYLDLSAAHYELADQKALLPSVYNYRAATYFQQGKVNEAIKALEQSLAAAENFGVRPQAALAKRLLGEALLQSAPHEDALSHLEQAHSDFVEMGMTMEQAASLISIGVVHLSASETDRARSAFEGALLISENSFPEIDWRAHVELGHLAGAQGNLEEAIRFYHRGMEAFTQIRRNFLQPTLAGSYLQAPAQAFDRIVTAASQADSAQDALQFIEGVKASTLLRNLSEGAAVVHDPHSQESDDLKTEINILRDQLRTSFEETTALQTAFRSKLLREELRQKITQYDEMKTRLERRDIAGMRSASLSDTFDLDSFRTQASACLPGNWFALDYYLTEEELVTVITGADTCRVGSQPVTNRFLMALDACKQARLRGEPPLAGDLEILGRQLIPSSLAGQLTPDTHILIAPHRRLHQVPWSALQPGFVNQPLVCLCIPCIVPSLHSLSLLWARRDEGTIADPGNGLILGASSFQGVHPELPMVREEIAGLAARLGPAGRLFAEQDARWAALTKLRGEGNLNRFAWLHIASHFSSERQTGRLSGIVLSDGDISLDQVRDLAPLPGLVSLSACNSNDAFLYEGDERVDLQTTCFIAGADSVIGSAWRIPDRSAAELMLLFYDRFLSGANPAAAVAHAQRQFIEQGKDLKTWASFHCAGVP